jgi:hypothetical protein
MQQARELVPFARAQGYRLEELAAIIEAAGGCGSRAL